MGTEAAWVPYVISAVGTALSAGSQIHSMRKADEAAAAGIAANAAKQREADTRINQQIQAVTDSSPEGERAAATEAFMNQLRTNRASAISAGTPGNVSDAFDTRSTEAKAAVQNYGERAANVMARISAAGRQRQNENVGMGRTATDVGLIGRDMAANEFLTGLRAQNAARGNPLLEAGGSLLTGIGQGMATRPPGGKAFGGKLPTGAGGPTPQVGVWGGDTRGLV